jgi:capsule assembly protein Wzi
VRLALAVALAFAAAPSRAAAPPASPLLPPGHWAVAAAARLHDLGLAPQWMPAQRAAPLAAVAETLRRAAEAEDRGAGLARLWWQRFQDEFPRVPGTPSPVPGVPGTPSPAPAGEGRGEGLYPALLSASASLGLRAGTTRELPRAVPESPAALHLTAPRTDPFLEAGAAAAFGPHLAAGASALATPDGLDLPSLELVVAAGPVALSVGRAPVRYGPNEVGAVVMGGGAAVRRLEAMTTAPVRLPYLGFLGDFALDLALMRFEETRHPYTPLLWASQLSWRPHPRLTLSAIRGFMFGGAPWQGIGAGDAIQSILGTKNASGNNVYAGGIRWRLPTEAALPLTARLEWGTDDEPGAAFSWPGLVAGLSTPLLPGLPAALGVEGAFFGKSGLGFHDPFGWYAHDQYRGGWATGETPLGDPLGGNGRALRVTGALDLFDARLRLAGAAAISERDRLPDPDNLYAPQAAGRSAGLTGEAEWRQGRFAFGARGAYERGDDGWRRGELTVRATAFF